MDPLASALPTKSLVAVVSSTALFRAPSAMTACLMKNSCSEAWSTICVQRELSRYSPRLEAVVLQNNWKYRDSSSSLNDTWVGVRIRRVAIANSGGSGRSKGQSRFIDLLDGSHVVPYPSHWILNLWHLTQIGLVSSHLTRRCLQPFSMTHPRIPVAYRRRDSNLHVTHPPLVFDPGPPLLI